MRSTRILTATIRVLSGAMCGKLLEFIDIILSFNCVYTPFSIALTEKAITARTRLANSLIESQKSVHAANTSIIYCLVCNALAGRDRQGNAASNASRLSRTFLKQKPVLFIG